jgi:hypothetical protein
MKKREEKIDWSKLSPEERKAKKQELKAAAMDQMFGKNRDQYVGNIWGWSFSLFGLAVLILIGGLAVYGIRTGQINVDEQMKKGHKHPFYQGQTKADSSKNQ